MAFLRSLWQFWRGPRRARLLSYAACGVAVALAGYYLNRPTHEVLAPRGANLAGYVGAARCAQCHQDMHDEQAHTSMALTLHTAEEYQREHHLPLPAELFDAENRVRYRIDCQDGKLWLEAARGREVARAEMTYALGSGKVAVTFVRDLDAHSYQELRATYYADTNAWDLTPGQRSARPASVTQALGRPIAKHGEAACLNCHATLVVQTDGKIDPSRSRFGLDCESCHGPGRAHAESAENGSPIPIRMPAFEEALKLARQLVDGETAKNPREELLRSVAAADDERLVRDLYVCGECHGYQQIWQRSSDNELIKFQVAALVASPCYTRSQNKIRCTDCHDPHRDSPRDNMAAYVAVCLQCHAEHAADAVAGEAPEQPHSESDKVCPENPRDGCIACHMPPRPPMPHAMFTHHRIGIYRNP